MTLCGGKKLNFQRSRKMTKKIKVILTCLKQTSYEDYTHFFKSVEIEVPYNEGEEWHVCGEEYQDQETKEDNDIRQTSEE